MRPWIPLARCRIVLLAVFIGSDPAFAQASWRSTLYPADWTPPTHLSFESDKLIQDFSYAGYHRGETDLPDIQSPVFDVTTYGADPTGAADSTAAIQTAIDAAAAAGGGVVALPAGTFKVSPQGTNTFALRITASRIVLRGAGRDSTFIFNDSFAMRGKDIIRVEGSASSWSTVPAGASQPSITEDLLRPTVTIPVASTAGLVVGDWILLRADATDAFVAEHNTTDVWAGLNSSLGGVQFLRQIVAIDPTTSRLTIDAPIRYYLKTREHARLHRAVPFVEEVGLEDFSIGNRQHAAAASATGWGEEDYRTAGNGSYDVHDSYAIELARARNCWITDVASYRPAVNSLDTHVLSNGIHLRNCRGVTVRRCEFQRPLYGGGGGNGYMYRVQNSNECLIRDSIARHHRHGFVFAGMACSGNVIHGGLGQDTRVQAAGSGVTAGEGNDHHMHLSHSNLIDGVQLDRDFFDAYYRGTFGAPTHHGHSAAHSVFWNLDGLAYQANKTFIVRSEQARYGYIIGTRGPANGMRNTTSTPASRTAPLDHMEGAGIGAALQPPSLYQDQLVRRLTPLVTQQPANTSAGNGGGASFTVAGSNTSTFQWQRNGVNVANGTSATLSLLNVAPAIAGLYHAVLTGAQGTTISSPAILGVSSDVKLIGSGTEYPDIFHSLTGNTYDQILLGDSAATIKADSQLNQITRMSYVDLQDDIVQVEFAGPGSLTLVLEHPSGPALPVNYDQNVPYMRGHASIVVTGATENTHLSVFSVGRGNAINQTLFRDNVDYDGSADIGFIAIQSANGKFGGLRTGNTSYTSSAGYVGVYAAGVEFNGPVNIGNIAASSTAIPVLVLGSATEPLIAGGDLDQPNDRMVRIAGFTRLKFARGSTSHFVDINTTPNELLPAQDNRAIFEADGNQVEVQVTIDPGP